MVIYFIISIIHSMAQSYHKRLAQPRTASASTSKTQVIKQSHQSDWVICSIAAQVVATCRFTRAALLLTVAILPMKLKLRNLEKLVRDIETGDESVWDLKPQLGQISILADARQNCGVDV